MRTFCKLIVLALGLLLGTIVPNGTIVPIGTALAKTLPNGPQDDYAPAFRQLPNGGAELWFTSVDTSKPGGRSRRMMVSSCTVSGFEAPVPVDDPNINLIGPAHYADSGVILNGVPSFECDGMRGVFVSNRLVNGKDCGNDIYEMCLNRTDRSNASGYWEVRRLDEVDSTSWDETPFLSANGDVLYFASDRRNPGSKHTELFYSKRSADGVWSAPKPIDILDDQPGTHEAPCVGSDGFFYYATNVSGHNEIWRARMDSAGILPAEKGGPVKGVNSPTSDQTDPTFSPGGNWLLYASNSPDSGGKRDMDIRWVLLNDKPQLLQINVQERLRLQNSFDLDVPSDTTEALSTTVTFRDSATGIGTIVPIAISEHSDKHGNCTIPLPRQADPAVDAALRTGFLSAEPPSTRFVSATDKLHYVVDSRSDFDRTLFVWDTSSYYDPSCKQTFPIADVRFFIQGYWGPTTYKYRDFLKRNSLPSCPSFFDDSICLVAKENCVNCQSNNLYEYKYESKPNVSVTRDGKGKHQESVAHEIKYSATRSDISDCFDYDEFRKFGTTYAAEVDGALDNLKTSMQSALMLDCILSAKKDRQKIEITVTGYTDSLKYRDPDCEYSGATIHFPKETVHLLDSEAEPFFVQGTKMNARGGGGNPLLSDLRAYWAAVLLDSIWNSSVPAYQELRRMGLLVIKAEGKSVNPDAKRTLAAQRSIAVEVKTENQGVWKPGQKPHPGQVVELWNHCELGSGRVLPCW